jgi:uncharacterized protein (DUF488 family)
VEAASEILTVGHSNHPIDRFLALLRRAGVEVIADVRRFPASRRNPQFNAKALATSLAEAGIAYEPFGDELGGRRGEDPFVAYAEHMATDVFAAGIERLESLARGRRTAPMCAEGDWRHCHRRLVADALTARGWRVVHLLGDGGLEPHPATLEPQ